MNPLRTKTVGLLTAVLTMLAVAMTACGSGGSSAANAPTPTPSNRHAGSTSPYTSPPSPQQAGPNPLPVVVNEVTPISSGTYRTAALGVPVTMTLSGDWTLFDNNSIYVQMNSGSTFTEGIRRNMYVFRYYGKVIESKDNRSVGSAPNPIAWLLRNPHLRVTRGPSSVRVGGVKATEIDLQAVKPPNCSYYPDPPSRCWNVMPFGKEDPFSPRAQQVGEILPIGTDPSASAVQVPVRLVVVPVHGATIVLEWNDRAPTFNSSLDVFKQVLSRVKWS